MAEELLNPLCGDKVGVTARVSNSKLHIINHDGHGCAISQASAAILADHLVGKTFEEVETLIDVFYRLILKPDTVTDEEKELIGDAKILSGVAKLPGRHRCALLAWENLKVGLMKFKEKQKEVN